MLAVLGVVLAAVLGVFGSVTGAWGGQVSRARAVQSANLGLLRMGREIGGAVSYEPRDAAGWTNVFTLPADADAAGNPVPASVGGGLVYQNGPKTRFYLSNATGSPNAPGSILWRATAPAGSSVWTPDADWSLLREDSGRGRIENVSALAFSQANLPANVVLLALTLTVKEGAQISVLTLRRDVFLANSNPPGGGPGLNGDYYADRNALGGGPTLTRTDTNVDFGWGAGSPDPSLPADNFFVRWTGQALAPLSGTYTFYTISDDGVRLWVNGSLVIDNWTDHSSVTNASPAVTLEAGRKYDIKMEYYEGGGDAVARLQWAYPGQTQQPIPQAQLFPGSGSGLPPAPTGLTANASGSQAVLAWTAVSSASGYNLYRAPTSGGLYALVASAVPASPWTDAGRSAGATYFYVVSAVNGAGEGVNSAEARLTFAPAAPASLSAAPGSLQASLSWTASPGAASYSLYRATTAGGEGATPIRTGLTGTTFTDTGLTAGTTYFYQLTAANAGGESGRSSEASATP